MKKTIHLIILLLFTFSLFAQTSPTAKRSTIYYSMQNMQLNSDTVNFGIYSYLFDSIASLYGGGSIIFRYDTAKMGPSAVSAGRLRARMASSLNTAAYSLSLSDLSANQAQMQISPTANLDTTTALPLAQTPTPLLSVQATPLATSGAFTDSTVALDSVPMQNQSTYLSPATSTLMSYDTVKVSDNLKGSPQSNLPASALVLSIANETISGTTYSPYLDFDISDYTELYSVVNTGYVVDYQVTLYYDAQTYDSIWITSQMPVGDDGSQDGGDGNNGGNALYDFSYTVSGDTIILSFTDTGDFEPSNINLVQSYDVMGIDYLAHIKLHIAQCGNTPNIYIDPSSSFADWWYTASQPSEPFSPIDTSAASYGNNGNPYCILPPSVSGFSPACIGAGSFEVLTIYGQHFGTDTGTVYFTNANPPPAPAWVATYPQDIRLWSDNEIQLLIPSLPESKLISASGVFYVQTAGGMDNSVDNVKISIAYANYNIRNDANPLSDDYNKAMFVYYPDSVIKLQADSALMANDTAINTINAIISELNCRTGFNFYLSTTVAPIDTPVPDRIRLISLKPYSSGLFDSTDLIVTDLTDRMTKEYNGMPAYNNWSEYIYDGDITIRTDPPGGRTWNWNNLNSPDTSQYDFLTCMEHELGHYALLCHTLPGPDSNDVMFWGTPPGYRIAGYGNDPDDMLGVVNMLSAGRSIGAADGIPGKQSFYICPSPLTPTACALRISGTDGIEDINVENTFSATLYPNPYQDNTILHVETSIYEQFTITVFDILGRTLRQVQIASDSSFDVALSGFEQAAGMYLIEVSDGHNGQVLKLIKL